MAFEQHIEADSPDDMGLLSSIIRAPVLGIIWMLGGGGENKSSVDEDADDEDLTLKNKRIDSELLDHKNGINGGGGFGGNNYYPGRGGWPGGGGGSGNGQPWGTGADGCVIVEY